MREDTVWIPAVPLPLMGWRTDQCVNCGVKFRGKTRRHDYEIHFRRAHQRASNTPASETVLMEVSRTYADMLYAEVNSDAGNGS